MANSWFRFYHETLNDPKVQLLPAETFKIWVNMLCLACACDKQTGEIGTIDDVTFALRVTKEAVTSASQTLEQLGLIVTVGETSQQKIKIKNWTKRQYQSDSSAQRTREYRERKKAQSVTVPCNVTVTPPDTDTDTDTDTEQKEKPPKPPLPDWLPVAEWDGFLEMRRKIKKPPTERAQDLLLAKLAELRKQGHDPTAVIQQSIRNSWQDVFPLRQQTRNYTEQREENRRLERQRVGI